MSNGSLRLKSGERRILDGKIKRKGEKRKKETKGEREREKEKREKSILEGKRRRSRVKDLIHVSWQRIEKERRQTLSRRFSIQQTASVSLSSLSNSNHTHTHNFTKLL